MTAGRVLFPMLFAVVLAATAAGCAVPVNTKGMFLGPSAPLAEGKPVNLGPPLTGTNHQR